MQNYLLRTGVRKVIHQTLLLKCKLTLSRYLKSPSEGPMKINWFRI